MKVSKLYSAFFFALGLIAMLRQDFESAVTYLSAAYVADATHDGIRKSLGYSYGWSGRLESGINLLTEIPNAEQELQVYEGWWGEQDREDLAGRSAEMAAMLTGP